MKPLPTKITVVFWLLVASFALQVAGIIALAVFAPARGIRFGLAPLLVFSALGVVLVVLVYKAKLVGPLRRSLLVAGYSAAGVAVCAFLHNLAYALLVTLWPAAIGGADGDEPVFLLLAIVVLPLVFVVSAVRSVMLITKQADSRLPKPPAPPGQD